MRDHHRANRRLLWRLLPVAVGMFGFGFALVPLYDVFCEVTGLNGKTGRTPVALPVQVDKERLVTVQFVAHVNQGLPWTLTPLVPSLRLHPGEAATVAYRAENQAGRAIVGQAVPSVAPGSAARYLSKTECFCFTEQTLQPYEARTMPVRLVLHPQLPPEVTTVTLSYTFFDTGRGGQAHGP